MRGEGLPLYLDAPDYTKGVAISGSHAYVANEQAGLQVIDITNPESPKIVGSVDTPVFAEGVAVLPQTSQ